MRPTTKIRSGDMAKSAQMTVSDEVAIEISEMNKWFGSFHSGTEEDTVRVRAVKSPR